MQIRLSHSRQLFTPPLILLPLPRPPRFCTALSTTNFFAAHNAIILRLLSLGLLQVVLGDPLFLVATRTGRSHFANRRADLTCTFVSRLQRRYICLVSCI